jgi:hypothetical protein
MICSGDVSLQQGGQLAQLAGCGVFWNSQLNLTVHYPACACAQMRRVSSVHGRWGDAFCSPGYSHDWRRGWRFPSDGGYMYRISDYVKQCCWTSFSFPTKLLVNPLPMHVPSTTVLKQIYPVVAFQLETWSAATLLICSLTTRLQEDVIASICGD